MRKNRRSKQPPKLANPIADQCVKGCRYHPTKGWKKIFGYNFQVK